MHNRLPKKRNAQQVTKKTKCTTIIGYVVYPYTTDGVRSSYCHVGSRSRTFILCLLLIRWQRFSLSLSLSLSLSDLTMREDLKLD